MARKLKSENIRGTMQQQMVIAFDEVKLGEIFVALQRSLRWHDHAQIKL
jgi:hypothetical protein